MSVTRIDGGAVFTRTSTRPCQRSLFVKRLPAILNCGGGRVFSYLSLKESDRPNFVTQRNVLALGTNIITCGKCFSTTLVRSSADYGAASYDSDGVLNANEKDNVFGFVETSSRKSHYQSVRGELIALSLPAIAGQAVEPFAQLMETAFIGRLGPLELASAGVSISIFNIISKLFNIPLLSVATSFVAEDISKSAINLSAQDAGLQEDSNNGRPVGEMDERKQLPSVSTALVLAAGIGIFEALALYFGSGLFLNAMGLSSASSMRIPAQRFLSLRALGAPANVLSLALQGIFRGFKDTKTPVLCLGIGNLSSIFLFPMLMYSFGLGVTGAALATVTSQYMVTFLMLWFLNKRAVLLPPKLENLHFGSYMKSEGDIF